MKTAEWLCTVCGSTNRRLVSDSANKAKDRCLTCHTFHIIEADDRPVRWRSTSMTKRPLSKPALSSAPLPPVEGETP